MEGRSAVLQIEKLLPLAVDWVSEQQERIMREGVPLTGSEMFDARKIGVKMPERVRLLQIEAIPFPSHPLLKAACEATNLVPAAPRGLAVFYGLFIRSDYWRDRTLIVHELAHTAQYERLGGIEPFLHRYIAECATVGYARSPLEGEATRVVSHLCVSR
jgi:hypothetical protein